MKTININYDSMSRESLDNVAAEVMSTKKAVITTADKNVDKSNYTVTVELVDGRWHVSDNDPLHANREIATVNRQASLPDDIYDAQAIIRHLILDIVENTASEEDVVITIEDNNENEEDNESEETEQHVEFTAEDGRTYNVIVREDEKNFYIDFQAGLGEGIYPKADWTLEKAIEDQANI